MADLTNASALARDTPGEQHCVAPRTLHADPAYWLAMLAASAFGTNVGDFLVDELFASRTHSLLGAVICGAVAVLADRRLASRSEAAYWAAVVLLRAAATNFADYLTHDLRVGYVLGSVTVGVLALVAACFTKSDSEQGGVPRVDGQYWIAMLLTGFFGTVCGDLVSHTVGLYASSTLLCGVLVLTIVARSLIAPMSVLLYWCVVLAERCAGTGVGDMLASGKAVGFGLPLSMACTGSVFLLLLIARSRFLSE